LDVPKRLIQLRQKTHHCYKDDPGPAGLYLVSVDYFVSGIPGEACAVFETQLVLQGQITYAYRCALLRRDCR
jgi:hypothetical protein